MCWFSVVDMSRQVEQRARSQKASSARAADLLAAEGFVGGFGGFGGFGEALVFKTEVLEVDDGELNMCFRKLGKKDSTTKIKALEEMAVLFGQRTPEQLASILPAWVCCCGAWGPGGFLPFVFVLTCTCVAFVHSLINLFIHSMD